MFVQKAFLLGIFSEELSFGGAYYWREFSVSKWVGQPKSLRKQPKTTNTNSPWVYIREGLLSEGIIFTYEI